MGIFGNGNIDSFSSDDFNAQELLETYIMDELMHLPEEERIKFVQSEAADTMMKKGLIGKKTLVRLSKADDMERRIGMAALQIAKDKDDRLFTQLTKVRLKERELLNKINKKYENQATRAAKMGQKDYLKKKLPIGFFRKTTP